MSLDVAYVGSQSRHLQDNRNLNYNAFGQCFLPQNQDPQRVAASPTALLGNNCKDANFLKPYLGYDSINLYESQSTANYNALQIQVQRRTTKGLFIGAVVHLEQGLATAQSGGTNDNSFVRPDQFNRHGQLRPGQLRPPPRARHQLRLQHAEVQSRELRFTRLITDGWQLSGVTQALTGSPFTPGFSISGAGNQNITGSNTEGARIGVVAGCDPYTHSSDPFNRLEPGLLLRAVAGQRRPGIRHQLPVRSRSRQLRHGGCRRSSR